jgi:sortase (surface protein transpeptidase)
MLQVRAKRRSGIVWGIGAVLVAGDSVRVQMGDLSWRTYEVVSVTTYDVLNAKEPLFRRETQRDSELHLITCDGAFDDRTQFYDRRTIVVAVYSPG